MILVNFAPVSLIIVCHVKTWPIHRFTGQIELLISSIDISRLQTENLGWRWPQITCLICFIPLVNMFFSNRLYDHYWMWKQNPRKAQSCTSKYGKVANIMENRILICLGNYTKYDSRNKTSKHSSIFNSCFTQCPMHFGIKLFKYMFVNPSHTCTGGNSEEKLLAALEVISYCR